MLAVLKSAKPKLAVAGGHSGSPERTDLAEAVAQFKAAEARRNAVLKAEEAAGSAVWEARNAMTAAEAAVAEAREEAVRQTVARLMGEEPTGANPVTKASEAFLQAKTQHEDAVSARDILNARRGDDDRAVQNAAYRLEVCINSVISAEGAARAVRVADDVIRLQRELAVKADELLWLTDHKALPQEEGYTGIYSRPANEEVKRAIIRLREVPVITWTDLLPRPNPSGAWAAARDALRSDPAAPLPGGDR